jgi:hypothetical protein
MKSKIQDIFKHNEDKLMEYAQQSLKWCITSCQEGTKRENALKRQLEKFDETKYKIGIIHIRRIHLKLIH